MSLLINPYAFNVVPPAATREYRALKAAANQSGTTLTVAGCDTGAADVGRHVFGLFFFAREANVTVTSATIGGVAAKVHVQRRFLQYFDTRYSAALLSAPLDAGLAADVSVTLDTGGTYGAIRCATWRVVGLQSDTPSETVSTSNSSSAIGVDEGGLLIGGTYTRNAGGNIVASGWTQDFDSTPQTDFKVFGASAEIDADDAAFSFAAANSSHGMIAASFR